MQYKYLSPNELELICPSGKKSKNAFLIKIGQVAPTAPKPVTTKKDEE
jgi:hypothetical protein